MKNCNHCGLRLPDDAFNWRYRLLGIRHKTCRNCQNEYQRSWYQKHRDLHLIKVQTRKANVRLEARQFVLEYLSTHACTECGESDPMVLEFHHLRGKDREISVMIAGGSLRDRSWRTAYLMYPDLMNARSRLYGQHMPGYLRGLTSRSPRPRLCPWLIESIFLLDAGVLRQNLQRRGAKIAATMSASPALWADAELYPVNRNDLTRLSMEQQQALA